MPKGVYERKPRDKDVPKNSNEEIKGPVSNEVKFMQKRLQQVRDLTGLNLYVCTVSRFNSDQVQRYVITEETDEGYTEVSGHYEAITEISSHLNTAYNIAALLQNKKESLK